MAEATTAAPVGAKEKYFFLLRRLHSLCGLVPIGVFLIFHLSANATVLAGGGAFQFVVRKIHLLEEAGVLVPVEMAFIFIPLAFHAILGIVIVFSAKLNVGAYRYGGNVRYTLQRITGIIAFFFIIFHVWQMHWLGGTHGGQPGDFFDPENAPWSAARILQSSLMWGPIYAIGVVSAVFHLANGIWTALITWGITIGPRSQRMAGYACTAFGVALSLVGLGALVGFKNFDTQAPADEHAVQTSALVGDAHSVKQR